jgi:hypothetical protein
VAEFVAEKKSERCQSGDRFLTGLFREFEFPLKKHKHKKHGLLLTGQIFAYTINVGDMTWELNICKR